MDPKDIIGRAATLAYFADLQQSSLDDYSVNEEQYNRFIKLIEYCKGLEKQYDCELFRCIFNPKWINGCVEVVFHGEWGIEPEFFKDFLHHLELCDCFNIAANPLGDDWVQVTFFVNDLWKRKAE